MRAISTVVDTTLFLFLLGGAVATLVVAAGTVHAPAQTGDPADETVELLATTTTTVGYDLTPRANESAGVEYNETVADFERTAHGTTAGLLAAATRSSVTVDDDRLAPASGGFERAVRNETRAVVQRREAAVAVTATWEPYDGAPIESRVHVGPDPPATADVRAARLTVDSGFEPSRQRAIDAARVNGTDGVARVVARSIVTGLFPPDETCVALRGDAPVDTLTAHRYRRAGRVFDAPLLDIEDDSVEQLNAALVDALADRLATDVDRRFETPEAVARSVATGEVRIVVRTWSP